MDAFKSWCTPGVRIRPLLFLIYINDLTNNISSDMRLFAGDSSLFACVTELPKRTTNWLRTWLRTWRR